MAKYTLICLLSKKFNNHQHGLRDKIAKETGLTWTKKSNIPAHITLKYHFSINKISNLKKLEKIISEFCKIHKKTEIKMGGFGHFGKETIFIKAKLSKQANKAFLELLKELHQIKFLHWESFEGPYLKFHSTLVQKADPNFSKALVQLREENKDFNEYFDNISILKLVKEYKTHHKYKVFRRFNLLK